MKQNTQSIKTTIAGLLLRAYAFDREKWRKTILRAVKRIEGGEFYSDTLRKIFSKYHGINIGMYSYGGCFSPENIQPGTEIGRYCSFARQVYIYRRDHPLKHKSTHPFFYNSRLKIVEKDTIPMLPISIGNDVWIGMNAIIVPSVSSIGDGAVIGAGSIVTKDVPPYAVVAGNPARIIKYRFNQETIDHLAQSQWWNLSIDQLAKEIINYTIPIE